MKKKILYKVLTVALHLCGWALLFISRQPRLFGDRLLPPPGGNTAIGNIQGGPPLSIAIDPTWFRVEAIITNILLAAFFYTNMFVLVPKVLTRKGWWPYMLLVFLSFSAYLLAGYFIRLNFFPFELLGRRFAVPLFMGVPNFLMVFGLSLALRMVQDRSAFENTIKEQENERLKSELSFLRSQVSPHFMFNVLNSLASLARKKSAQVESAIIQLSQLMRYTLYQTDKRVTLEQEVEYIRNYIELQKLRFGSKVNMHFQVNMERIDLKIEPMLLIPFVENAFKHGVGLIENPVIIILLEGNSHRITLTVRNKYNPSDNEVKDSSSGIGLQNVKRRLDLLYKDVYTLKMQATEDNWFITELKIIP